MEKHRRRVIVRGVALIVGIYLAFEGARLFLAAYPQVFFPHREEHGAVVIYSDVPIDFDAAAFAADLRQRAALVPIVDAERTQRVFLCSHPELFGSLMRIMGRNPNAQGVSLPFRNNVLVNRSFVDKIRRQFGDAYRHTMLAGDEVQIALHEIVHAETSHRLGWLRFRGLPEWKREGYAEYASTRWSVEHDPLDDFRARARRALAPDHLRDFRIRRFYARSQILVEYLSRIRGLDFDQIMDRDVRRDDVLAEVEAWLFSSRA